MFIIIANKKESPNPVAMWKMLYKSTKSRRRHIFLYIIATQIYHSNKKKENKEKLSLQCVVSNDYLFHNNVMLHQLKAIGNQDRTFLQILQFLHLTLIYLHTFTANPLHPQHTTSS